MNWTLLNRLKNGTERYFHRSYRRHLDVNIWSGVCCTLPWLVIYGVCQLTILSRNLKMKAVEDGLEIVLLSSAVGLTDGDILGVLLHFCCIFPVLYLQCHICLG